MLDKLIEQAISFQEAGKWSSAQKIYTKILKRDPRHLDANYMLGTLMAEQGRYREAERLLKFALKLNNTSVYIMNNLANVHRVQKKYRESIAIFQNILALKPSMWESHLNIADLFLTLNEDSKAYYHIQQVLQKNPDSIDAKIALHRYYEKMGDINAADNILHQLLKKNSANCSILSMYAEYAWSSRLRKKDMEKALVHIEKMILLHSHKWIQKQKIGLYYHTGKLYEKCGQYDKAFGQYINANKLADVTYNRTTHLKFIDTSIKKYDAPSPQTANNSVKPPKCIFIVGMPRTGSTLIEGILLSHPIGVQSIGEANTLKEAIFASTKISSMKDIWKVKALPEKILERIRLKYLEQWNRKSNYFVNKNLFSYLFLGAITHIFKDAIIIHMKRNPLDTILSCFATNFEDSELAFSFDLEDLGWYYSQYQKLMNHWSSILGERILTISYEEIAGGNEKNIKDFFNRCGLPYSPEWRDFYKSDRAVKTASYRQVKQPLYSTSIYRSDQFKKHLAPASNYLSVK